MITPALLPQRMQKRVKLGDCPVIGLGDCWLWTGYVNQEYGRMSWQGKSRRAHRVAYLLCVGDVPQGLELDHLCRVKNCINPAHLEPVTHLENILRGDSVPAKYARATHCLYGHEFSPENTVIIIRPDSGVASRRCRICRSLSDSLRRAFKNNWRKP